jgi:acyl-CoA thioester hydrolase
MPPFSRTFQIGWNDLDANAHVANTAYMGMMNETRMTFFRSQGIDEHTLADLKVGPAVLNELYYYYKELRAGDEVMVDLQLLGRSEDGRFGRIGHQLFRGTSLAAYSELTFCWMDLDNRRILNPLLESIEDAMEALPKSGDYHHMDKDELGLGGR